MGEIKTTISSCVGCRIDTSGCSQEIVNLINKLLSKVNDDLQKVADINKEEQKKKETKKRWKPNINEEYYSVDQWLTTYSDDWGGEDFNEMLYEYRNVFKTGVEAEFEAERRKIMIELQNYADEHNGEIAHPSDAFWLGFDEDNMLIIVEDDSIFPPVGTVLFSDADTAYNAIKAIGEDRIIKYMFGIDLNKEFHCNGDCECCDEYDPWDDDEEDED